MVASRPGSPYTGGRPSSANSVHTKVEEDLHEYAGIDYDKVSTQANKQTMHHVAMGTDSVSGHHHAQPFCSCPVRTSIDI